MGQVYKPNSLNYNNICMNANRCILASKIHLILTSYPDCHLNNNLTVHGQRGQGNENRERGPRDNSMVAAQ